MNFDPIANYEETKNLTGFVNRKNADDSVYEKLGFKSGLEVHQQLKTKEKLFCRCPVGMYQDFEDYDAELVRHMRPTLSEMGTYDGTALMEFRTRKNIYYRIKSNTTCTYEVDDTPPFPLNREALEYAIEISLLLKQSIVGELHITRKQYLDGSIPAGFQRTAIVGIEGDIPLKNKKIRIIQLSIEEDSCREVSDIGHDRVYAADRLGTPLIETVTYPEMLTPDEVKEAAHYIRFLNRSTGHVRMGIGAGREDVNVSIEGGTRVEIKGVAHISWIPELVHVEAFRQKALLNIKEELNKRVSDPEAWKPEFKEVNFDLSDILYSPIKEAMDKGYVLVTGNLPEFKGILSHFTQPDKNFADEIMERLKVIACLEKPNMLHSEDELPIFDEAILEKRRQLLNSGDRDAQIVFWAAKDDVQTAQETIEERCRMAFYGVPEETRKSFANGNTIFERVLPGADRMYPDTDSAPIPIENDYIEDLRTKLPVDLAERLERLKEWKIPEEWYTYILRNNLMPLVEDIVRKLKLKPKFVISLFSQYLKYHQNQLNVHPDFQYEVIAELLENLKKEKIELELAVVLLPYLLVNPKLEFASMLDLAGFKKNSHEDIIAKIPELISAFKQVGKDKKVDFRTTWVMGHLRSFALGNIKMKELRKAVKQLDREAK